MCVCRVKEVAALEADQVKYDLSIPIWVKAVLTPEEAAALGGVDTRFIRAHGDVK